MHSVKRYPKAPPSTRPTTSKAPLYASSQPPLLKLNCSEYLTPMNPLDDRTKNSSKRTTRLKSNRKHQASLEIITNQRGKETKPSSKAKNKQKVNKKHVQSKAEFVVGPINDWSRSNSLIAFSEKDSTMSHRLKAQAPIYSFNRNRSPNRAATLIQKTWRGYLTRRLLQQYIVDQEQRLSSAMCRLKSKEDSIRGESQDLDFDEMSSIEESGKVSSSHFQASKQYVLFTTQHESQQRSQSPIRRSFFNSHSPVHYMSSKRHLPNLALQSNTINQSHQSEALLNFDSGVLTIRKVLTQVWQKWKTQLRGLMEEGSIQLAEMIERSSKLKGIHDQAGVFLDDVSAQLDAIVQDLQSIALHNPQIQPKGHINMSNIAKVHPKSEVFTVEVEQPPVCQSRDSHAHQKLSRFLKGLQSDKAQNHPQSSQIEFLCHTIRQHSEQGVDNMLERCLMQFTVDIVTEGHALQGLERALESHETGGREGQFLRRWLGELERWEMGPIQEVTEAMESSSFITQCQL